MNVLYGEVISTIIYDIMKSISSITIRNLPKELMKLVEIEGVLEFWMLLC